MLVDENSDEEDEDFPEQSFLKVISDMVVSAILEGHPADSVLMEIKGFKFAQNKVRLIVLNQMTGL
jgi:hypothetical protein